MAEEGKENQTETGSWWGSWISSAKTKTSTVFEAVKKDLDELSTAVRTEASNVGAAIENSLKFNEESSPVGSVKKSLSTFFDQVTGVLIPQIEDDDVETVLITRDGAITLTGFQKHLADLQNNDKTYLDEPDKELQDKYKLWLDVVEQDQFTQDRLTKHLASSEILNEKYLSLVPDKVSHMDFWQRYLFKHALLEDAIANAEIAERRAKIELNSLKSISPRKNIIQTEQPKLTCNEKEIIAASIINNTDNKFETEKLLTTDNKTKNDNIDNNKNNKNKNSNNNLKNSINNSKINSVVVVDTIDSGVHIDGNDADNVDDDELFDDTINWDHEEIPSNVELTEEEQIRLLEQYEQEIQEREKKRNENNAANINKGKKNNNTKSVVKTAAAAEANNNKQKTVGDDESEKRNDKQQPQKQHKDSGSSNDDTTTLIHVQKDHFNNKDETSSTSDESWEKDFDLND